MNKTGLLIATAFCAFAISCTQESQNSAPASAGQPVATVSPSPVVEGSPSPADAAGGMATREAGDTSAEEFEGTTGVVEKKRSTMAPAVLKEIRTGKHPSFDRTVFEFQGDAVPGYKIEYVKKAVNCGSGESVEIGGKGFLLVQLTPAQAHTEQGAATINDRQRVLNLPALKEMKIICDFEADVQALLGLNAVTRYRVLELSKPARLVVDIKH